MIAERLGIALRRAVAWWIDAFLVAAIVTVVRWVINALASTPLAGRPQEIYEAAALAVVFYIYRVWVETKKSTSLGKWSMQLEIIPARSPLVTACLRNSWLLLTPPDAYRLEYRRHYRCDSRPFCFSHRPNAL